MKYLKNFSETVDYPNFKLDIFRSLKTFAKRQKYCNDTLDRIGYGSSRAVYRINDELVLKLARSRNGIKQNYNEQQEYLHNDYGDIITKVFDKEWDESHEGYIWIISEIAKPITKERFKEITGVPFDAYVNYISEFYYGNRGFRALEASFKRKLTDEEYQLIHNSGDRNPFVERITGLISDNNLHIKALSDINKYGEVNREGDVSIVVKDYGVTDNYLEK